MDVMCDRAYMTDYRGFDVTNWEEQIPLSDDDINILMDRAKEDYKSMYHTMMLFINEMK